MMHATVPRSFTDANGAAVDAGYSNGALGVTGIALLFPPGARGAVVQVSAGCYIGVRPTVTLATFNNANYGSIMNGAPIEIGRGMTFPTDSTTYLHLAPWATTAIVSVFYY